MMLITSAVIFIALFGAAEPFKISLKQPVSQPEVVALPQAAPAFAHQSTYYQQPLPQQQTTLVESEQVAAAAGIKGAAPVAPTLVRQPLPLAAPMAPMAPIYAMPPPPPPQTLAYVFIRPIPQPQYQYLAPVRSFSKTFFMGPPAPLAAAPIMQHQETYQQAQPIRQQTFAATKGGEQQLVVEQQQQQVIEQAPTKGGLAAQPEAAIKQETVQEIYQEQQQPIVASAPLAPVAAAAPVLMAPVAVARGPGKFARLRSSFDRFAASAKSKLTLGSSYQVVGEEIVQQAAPQQPLEQQKQTQTQDIALTQQEQETIRETEQQEQQNFEPQQLEESKGQQQQQVVVQQQTVVEQKEQAKGFSVQQQQPQQQQQQQEEAVKESADGFRREQTRLGGQQFAQQKSQVQAETRYNSSKSY